MLMLCRGLGVLLLATFNPQLSTAFAQGTAFTYQGRLNDGTNPASGTYDLRFAVYDTLAGAFTIAGPVTNSAVGVSNGLFTVTLDFGASAFTGADRWLDIAVRTNGGGVFATLNPRQKITPTPYAVTAGNLAGVIANNSVNSALFATVGGGDGNAAGGFGSTVSGGLGNIGGAFYGTVSGGYLNTNNGYAAVIAGGQQNSSSGTFATIGGGSNNVSSGFGSVIGGGIQNTNVGDYTTIAGGWVNTIQSNTIGAVISGGGANVIQLSAGSGTISGGNNHTIQSNAWSSTIGGGSGNTIQTNAFGSTIGGGRGNTIQLVSFDSVIGGGFHNVIGTNAQDSTIGGGYQNNSGGYYTTIGGGDGNVIQTNAFESTISGGGGNSIQASADKSTIGGGRFNTIQTYAFESVISGGTNNTIQTGASGATISGGGGNSIQDYAVQSTIGGGFANIIQTNASYSTIGGGDENVIENGSTYSAIAGGQINGIATNAFYSTIGGGYGNAILPNASFATIPGGYVNVAAGYYSFAAGQSAAALHAGSFVWADSQFGQFSSTANNQFLVRAAGGVGINTANPMGNALSVNGDTRLDAQALGYNEGLALNFPTNMSGSGGYGGIHFHSAARNGAFDANSIKWGMFYNYTPENGIAGNGLSFVQNNTTTRLYISTNGNVGIGTLNPTNKLMVVNARCDGSSWINASDRNLKQGFAGVDAQAVLARVTALPVTTWSYKAQPGQKHLGPVAQDFHAAFGLGQDDTSISTVDESGVALAAIQGLNQKVECRSQEAEDNIRKLEAENAELKERLESLERRFSSSTQAN